MSVSALRALRRPLSGHSSVVQFSRSFPKRSFRTQTPPRFQAQTRTSQQWQQQGFEPPKRRVRFRLLKRWATSRYFYYQVGGLGVLAGGFYVSNLETVPISGRRRFNFVSPEQEREMAEYQYQALMKEFEPGVLPQWDPRVLRVKRVLSHLLNGLSKLEEEGHLTKGDEKATVSAGSTSWSKEDGLEGWTIHVIQSKMLNAMVMPG